jgi:hypothetical protein
MYKVFVITRYTNVYEAIKTNVIEFEVRSVAESAIKQINTNIVTGISVTAIQLF